MMMGQILAPENLRKAWQRVRTNAGAPGVDGMTVAAFPAFCRKRWPRIRSALLEGTCRPAPVRRVFILSIQQRTSKGGRRVGTYGMGAVGLIEAMRRALRVRHYRLRTEEAYLHWAERFGRFCEDRDAADWGNREARRFFGAIEGTVGLMGRLLYGTGMRLAVGIYTHVMERRGVAGVKSPLDG